MPSPPPSDDGGSGCDGAEGAAIQVTRVPASLDDAVRALLVLAREAPRSLPAREICRREQLSYRFASTILIALRHAGIVEALRGAHGGYRLARPAAAITLDEVVAAVDRRPPQPVPGSEATRPLWSSLERAARRRLAETTLAELLDPSAG